MSTSIVEGVVEEAKLKRARGGISIFDHIRFQLDDGGTRTINKAVVAKDVAEKLTPGSRGRFYLFTAFDLKGVHGVRSADGASVYGFPGNNEKVFILLGIVNILWIAFRVAVDGQVPFLAVGLIILAIVGYVLMSKGRREARKQFDDDESQAPAAVDTAPSVIG
ncbi:hypothetical protein [Sphingosinicella rhizophila]|uniref:Uncharacterized protein n=1 Tax=Sphingosinicella rhizophila TaxID=3050082 RepID=A0ABU3QB10_9SPHN|nr:hypothetical protein [Sphingosinicella sp. GR2756]MDT9600578.1 hypothetical protein [Sphingosinicella sp. GR2756]